MQATTANTVSETAPRGLIADLKNHPRGLLVLSSTELAERFSYYGMTALLVLYMVHQLLLPEHANRVIGLGALRHLFEWRGAMSDQAFASLVYGWYAGLVYFTPLFGGWIADRWLGARHTVTLGAIMMAGGHLAMAFDQSFLFALVLLICGSGCLKGNISAQVAPLYPASDESRRARGFTIFSTGINIGAVAGPLATGALAQAYGWHAGFACAAVLMMISLTIYVSGQRYLRDKTLPDESAAAETTSHLSSEDRLRVAAIFLLILVNVPIAASYYQVTNVGLVWVDRWADLASPLGPIPAAWFNSIDSFASIVAAAPLLALWAGQARRGREPDSIDKVWIGAMLNAVAPLILVAGILLSGPGAKVSVIWPIAHWVLAGVAFMFYWPLTLGLVAAKSPRHLRSRLMGSVFLSLFGGNLLVGWIGSFYDRMTPTQFWLLNTAVGLSAVLIIGLFRGFMRRHLTSQRAVSP